MKIPIRTTLLGVMFLGFAVVFFTACKEEDGKWPEPTGPTLYELSYPSYFDAPELPVDNPLTVEGISLGRKLFYDPILSGDNTQSCAGCHNADLSFTDNLRFSLGIDKLPGGRNGMAIINLAWDKAFFWDGRANSLEEQALGPVENPVEMHELWPNAVTELTNYGDYPALFNKAFGTSVITKELVAKAIAQFERTMISANSYYDNNYLKTGKTNVAINDPKNSIERGMAIFYTKGDCWHCHGPVGDYLFTDRGFHNNGLDAVITDIGLEGVTKNPMDKGKFKTTTLRNLAYTPPYMHDGRFKTLDEVIEHYNSGVKSSATLDPNMKELAKGLNLTPQEKIDLKEFLLSLTDQSFVTNINFKKP